MHHRFRAAALSRDVARKLFSSYLDKRGLKAKDLAALAEVRQAAIFSDQLSAGACEPYGAHSGNGGSTNPNSMAGPELLSVASTSEVRAALQAGMATFALHVEARVASALGAGFYTIGPCGEELLAAVGLVLRSDDAAALHYRHLATQVARHAQPLVSGANLTGSQGSSHSDGAQSSDPFAHQSALANLFLDRARGYVVSSQDPVTGGAHCALGGGKHDFVVTSTLASQATPAVGRAVAPGLMNSLGLGNQCLTPPKGLSYCSLGDGSVNNAHFLSAANLAKYYEHRRMRCPVLFGVSDNGLCISLKGHGWLPVFLEQLGLPVFRADGCNLASVFKASREATDYVRRRGKPAVLVFQGLPRRFGHAATDRQSAYLSPDEVAAQENTNPLGFACADAVACGAVTYPELASLWAQSQAMAMAAFDQASQEPKLEELGLESLMQRNHAPLVDSNNSSETPSSLAELPENVAAGDKAPTDVGLVRRSSLATITELEAAAALKNASQSTSSTAVGEGTSPPPPPRSVVRRNVMRKHMTACLAESFEKYPEFVYVGEDVEHGGYYLVTEGLAAKYPGRVVDLPPDETSLLGVAHGLAQSGLLVCVEVPYAKYLDCGADMFHEIITTHWLTAATGDRYSSDSNAAKRPPAGLVIRLQGFDRGVFGGNFHTHNSLPLPPGLDVVVFSNGGDWVKGWRHALAAAKQGRVVLVVDSTDLLNRKHIDATAQDGACLTPYPALLDNDEDDVMPFETVLSHPHGQHCAGAESVDSKKRVGTDDLTIITYGTGVMAARTAQRALQPRRVGILEVPCVSAVPHAALAQALSEASPDSILFADPCKATTAPLLHFIAELKARGELNSSGEKARDWALLAAADTYNPLGSTMTFLSPDQVTDAANALLAEK